MSYEYGKMRTGIFTEEGLVLFTLIRDRAKELLQSGGAVMSVALLKTVMADTWLALACMDYLCERDELYEITPADTAGQNRVFVPGPKWRDHR